MSTDDDSMSSSTPTECTRDEAILHAQYAPPMSYDSHAPTDEARSLVTSVIASNTGLLQTTLGTVAETVYALIADSKRRLSSVSNACRRPVRVAIKQCDALLMDVIGTLRMSVCSMVAECQVSLNQWQSSVLLDYGQTPSQETEAEIPLPTCSAIPPPVCITPQSPGAECVLPPSVVCTAPAPVSPVAQASADAVDTGVTCCDARYDLPPMSMQQLQDLQLTLGAAQYVLDVPREDITPIDPPLDVTEPEEY